MDIVDKLREMADEDKDMFDDMHVELLTAAADEIERLRRAATTAAEIIDKHLHTQREKVTDASAILRAALATQ